MTERQQVLLSTSCTFKNLNPVLAFLFILLAHITHWTSSISSNSKISLEMLVYLLAIPKVICLRKDLTAYYLGYHKQISARLFQHSPYTLQILHGIQVYLPNTDICFMSTKNLRYRKFLSKRANAVTQRRTRSSPISGVDGSRQRPEQAD